jgi:hypothetical protein
VRKALCKAGPDCSLSIAHLCSAKALTAAGLRGLGIAMMLREQAGAMVDCQSMREQAGALDSMSMRAAMSTGVMRSQAVPPTVVLGGTLRDGGGPNHNHPERPNTAERRGFRARCVTLPSYRATELQL